MPRNDQITPSSNFRHLEGNRGATLGKSYYFGGLPSGW